MNKQNLAYFLVWKLFPRPDFLLMPWNIPGHNILGRNIYQLCRSLRHAGVKRDKDKHRYVHMCWDCAFSLRNHLCYGVMDSTWALICTKPTVWVVGEWRQWGGWAGKQAEGAGHLAMMQPGAEQRRRDPLPQDAVPSTSAGSTWVHK